MAMMRQLLCVAAAILLSPTAFAYKPKEKDLKCDAQPTIGTRALCRTMEREMEWQWMGHATPAPGYAVGIKTVKNTYCKHPVTLESTDDLVLLALGRESGPAEVLADGARSLLQLLGPEVLKRLPDPQKEPDPRRREQLASLQEGLKMDFERRSTVFTSTDAPFYVLKDGCRNVKGARLAK